MGDQQIATYQQHLLYYMVKGQLVPDSWSIKDCQQMEESYTERLWNNNERHVYCIDSFHSLYRANKC
jgi:hypothetical protein